jgi:hypothetical protein
VLGNSPHDLQLDVACFGRRTGRIKPLATDLVPAHPEILGDVRDRRPANPRRRVVPADLVPPTVLARIEAIAGLVGEVDPADERDLVVDHDRFLVMAVHRPLAAVELHPDLRPAGEPLAKLAHVTP